MVYMKPCLQKEPMNTDKKVKFNLKTKQLKWNRQAIGQAQDI